MIWALHRAAIEFHGLIARDAHNVVDAPRSGNLLLVVLSPLWIVRVTLIDLPSPVRMAGRIALPLAQLKLARQGDLSILQAINGFGVGRRSQLLPGDASFLLRANPLDFSGAHITLASP